jgi:hypothetical protein
MRRFVLLGVLAGCVAPPEGGLRLDDPLRWTMLTPEQDPFVDHRPEDSWCPPNTWGEEDGGLEVQTGACRWFSASQPLPAALPKGAELEILVWHDLLDAAEPGTGHTGLVVDGEVLWEAEVDIPRPAGILPATVRLPRRVDAGAELTFHVHNHGFNSWTLVEVRWVR